MKSCYQCKNQSRDRTSQYCKLTARDCKEYDHGTKCVNFEQKEKKKPERN